MAYVPLSQRSTPNPTSPKFIVSPSQNHSAISQTEHRPSRPGRREQIAEQVEAHINRQTGPKDRAAVDRINQPIRTEVPPLGWAPVRVSDAPWDLVDRDARNRRMGWEKGRHDEAFFGGHYRRDQMHIPFLIGNYQTPNNSKVSDVSHWQSRDWFRVPTKRPKSASILRGVANNPRLMAALKRAAEEVSQEQRFLEAAHPVLGAFWKGVKVLGRGGQGVVGLWEYVGPGTHIWGRRIVIKQSLRTPLDEERKMMMALDDGTGKANHVVQLLYPIAVNRDETPQLFRIILEFCEGGDLDSLIIKHRTNKESFSEENLWLFFECFAKGLNIMDHGNESPERKQDSRNPMCHFDIKPMNVLRGNLDGEHTFMPINKIADFGLAACIDPTNYEHISRRRGTQGHLAPEQFSSRWAFRDAEKCGHINVWGTHTNIWQIGVLMYMLATLRGPPRPKGFRASAIGRKFTYGYKLHREKYSKALKSLIWRCLCDKPKDRPDLLTLHREISTALRAIRRFSYASDSQQRLDPPEPQDPSKGPPPGTGTGHQVPEGRSADKGTKARPKGAATGTRAAPFIIQGSTRVLRRSTFMFCVVPKHLPEGKQEQIWFRATADSTLRGLKQVIRDDVGFNLADEEQFIYLRLPGQPVLLLTNMARLLSLYGVGQDMRLELWTDQKAHDDAEPDEAEYDVL